MNFVLLGVNASYSHTCLGVRSISSYTGIPFFEFTINQTENQILREIALSEPDVILFSTYIWNAKFCEDLIYDIKNILPDCIIGAGGPEFGFAPKKYMTKIEPLSFIVEGEGEQTVFEIKKVLETKEKDKSNLECNIFEQLANVKGLWLKSKDNQIFYTGSVNLICNLSDLKFPYPELTDKKNSLNLSGETLENKILYYESSRGCPYSCSYCLSSVDKRVRFMPLERVFEDLQIFLDAKVPLVKFVDRTFNLKSERYIEIWKYILENHNKVTMFHFEIEAEYLTKEALDYLQKVPENVMQFEIGVQSANQKTLQSINRSDNIEKLEENIKKIPRTIHQHLDLIAGLPYENLDSFGHSFDFVMKLKPDALQLGFLKVLPGTQMENYAKQNGWKWMKNPVYETFSTPYLSYKDMIFLKDVEVLVDAFWNSKKFIKVMKYVGRVIGYWSFFYTLAKEGQKKNVFNMARRETFWFEFLFQSKEIFSKQLNTDVIIELLRFDFIVRGKQGGYPVWYEHRYDKQRHRILLENNGGIKNARLDFAHSEYEVFYYDVENSVPENKKGVFEKLIRY